MQRVSFDTLRFGGREFEFAISCTQIDVFCASIPLIWRFTTSVRANVLKLSTYFTCLFGFNILRLELGHLLLARGVPWVLAHESIAGVNLFIIFLWVVRNRGWNDAAIPAHSPIAITSPA